MSHAIFEAIWKQQSAARHRRDWKAARFWERVEFAVKDAIAHFYGGYL